MTPVSFTQTRDDGWTTGPHPWCERSPAIIRHQMNRTDLPEPVIRVCVTYADGSRATFRRRA